MYSELHKNSDDILGIVDYHYEFYSSHLKNERDIIVWYPDSAVEGFKRLPVLYMHDGQNLFSPNTSFIGFDWKVDETVETLLYKEKIREFIVVGIYNTKDRLEEYNYFTPKGKSYASFIIHELKPFIDENYSTLRGPEHTGIMGSSMGGLCSFQLAMKFPNIFGNAGCLSNSFWIDDKKIFSFAEELIPEVFGQKLYLDCGDAEKELIEDNRDMNYLLMKEKYHKNNLLLWNEELGAKHTEKDWAKRLHKPLTFMFGR